MNKQGKFGKFTVWYNLEGIANVILLKTSTEHYQVTYDSDIKGGAFTVHTKKGNIYFTCCPRGLHYLDLSQTNHAEPLMAMTVEER